MYHAVDGSDIPFPTTWDVKSPVNNEINYQPQLVQDLFTATNGIDLSS